MAVLDVPAGEPVAIRIEEVYGGMRKKRQPQGWSDRKAGSSPAPRILAGAIAPATRCARRARAWRLVAPVL